MGLKSIFKSQISMILNVAERIGFKDTVQRVYKMFPNLATDDVKRAFVLKKAADFSGMSIEEFISSSQEEGKISTEKRIPIDVLIYDVLEQSFGRVFAETYKSGLSYGRQRFENEQEFLDPNPTASLALFMTTLINDKRSSEVIQRQRAFCISVSLVAMRDASSVIDPYFLFNAANTFGARAADLEEVTTDADGKDSFFEDLGAWVSSFFNPEENVDSDEYIKKVGEDQYLSDTVIVDTTSVPMNYNVASNVRLGMGDLSMLSKAASRILS